MANGIVKLVYSRVVGSAPRKAVLGYFADRASEDGGGVYASKGRISRETELSPASVKKAVREFLVEGLIIETGTRRCANGLTKVYAMNVARISQLPKANPEPRHPVTPSPDNPQDSHPVTRLPSDPVTEEPPPGHPVTPTRSPGDPKPPRTTLEPERSDQPSLIGGSFEEFWSAYPHRGVKVGKKAAQRAWDKAIKRAPPDLIIRKAEAYGRYLHTAKGFVASAPDPATWLNGDRWNDETEPAEQPPNPEKSPEFQAAIAKIQAVDAEDLSVAQAKVAIHAVAANKLSALDAVKAVRRIRNPNPGWPSWVKNQSEYFQARWMIDKAVEEAT